MAQIKCLQCGNKAIVKNPEGTEVVELLPVDQVDKLQAEGIDFLISVCPHGCGCSTVAVLQPKPPVTKKEKESSIQQVEEAGKE